MQQIWHRNGCLQMSELYYISTEYIIHSLNISLPIYSHDTTLHLEKSHLNDGKGFFMSQSFWARMPRRLSLKPQYIWPRKSSVGATELNYEAKKTLKWDYRIIYKMLSQFVSNTFGLEQKKGQQCICSNIHRKTCCSFVVPVNIQKTCFLLYSFF